MKGKNQKERGNAMMLRTTEVAKILDVSKATLDTWRSRGGGPAYVKYNRAVRYRREDVDAFVSERIRQNTSGVGGLRRRG